MARTAKSPIPSFPVVAIGASAGGLEPTTELLGHIPPDSGMAFVVVHHLAEGTPSLLRDILARATKLPVSTVEDRLPVEPDHVYVMPETADMEIDDHRLSLVRRPAAGTHLPIDQFFSSLARSQGHYAVGVILSGAGSDGTKGLREIKAMGGWAFVQNAQTAKHNDMPRHAVEAGAVDFVGTAVEIANELVRVSKQMGARDETGARGTLKRRPQPQALADEEELLARIFLSLRQKTGVDFSRYKRGTLVRRIDRRMDMLRFSSLAQYLDHLQRAPEEVQQLFGDLLIGVTEFFRDAETFEYLKTEVFPHLIATQGRDPGLRLWVAGVSTGEEAYSMAISLLESVNDGTPVRAQIFATDISEENLEKARAGVFSADIAKEVSPERLERFFDEVDGGYRVRKLVRDLCVFARHNVVSDPPFSRLDLISCRNLMIYFDPVLQDRVAKIFHYALLPGGYLLLGRAESLPRHTAEFELIDRAHHLYTKKGAVSEVPLDTPAFGLSLGEPRTVAPTRSTRPLDSFDPRREAERVMAAAFAPASVLVNDSYQILAFQGKTGDFLEHPEGRPSFDLLRMAREGLPSRLRRALEEARKSMQPVDSRNIRLTKNSRTIVLDLEVRPFQGSDGASYFIVVFREHEDSGLSEVGPAIPAPHNEEPDEVTSLREEITLMRGRLDAVTEEKESGIEELRAANEEIQSSNEELQSTNEELQTAKEELESINEELTTINDQLEERNKQLTQANEFVANLLGNIDIPIVMVDRDLLIRRYSGTEDIFDFRAADVGRSVTDLALRVDIPDLAELTIGVIRTLQPVKRDVRHQSGRWYELRIRPYRSTDHRIEGAVLSFVDIDELKRSLEKFGAESRLSEAFADMSLVVASADGAEEILPKVMAEARQALQADAAILLMRSDSTLAARFTDGQADQLRGQTVDEDALPAVVEALSSHRPVFLDDVGLSRTLHGGPEPFHMASCLVAPLIVRDQASGILFFSWTEMRPFAAQTVDFAKRLAGLLSLLLANVELREQVQE